MKLNFLILSIATILAAGSAHAVSCTAQDVAGEAQLTCINKYGAGGGLKLDIYQQVCENGKLKSGLYKGQELKPLALTHTQEEGIVTYDETYGGIDDMLGSLKLTYNKVGTPVLANANMIVPLKAVLEDSKEKTTINISTNVLKDDVGNLYLPGSFVRIDRKTGSTLQAGNDLMCFVTVPRKD